VCVCVSAALVLTAKVMCCIQCCLVYEYVVQLSLSSGDCSVKHCQLIIIWNVHCTAGCCVQRLNEIRPDGAVRLAGYSFGACVAVEMALQLQQQENSGSRVQSLVLLDGSHSFVAAYTDRTRQRLEVSGDTPGTETGVICAFVNQFAFRFAHSDEVCYLSHKLKT